MQVFILKIIDKQITLSFTLEIGYSDTIYMSRNCHYCRLFLYQIILIGALSNQVVYQNENSSMNGIPRLNQMTSGHQKCSLTSF